MTIAQALLPEFDQEMKSTRQLLERVPAAKTDFKPHVKSWPLSGLSLHVANLPVWAAITFQGSELDLNPPTGPQFVPPKFQSVSATLAFFDENVRAARAAIAAASDADMHAPWSLKNAGQVLFTMPRERILRSFVISHLIHHRGQLTVYLRMCDVALPKTYGPTADVAF